MSRPLVVCDITMSLDGYVTGPDPGPDAGLGRGRGDELHRWVFSGHPVDQRVLDESMAASGAVVMGRNLFDVVDGPGGWSEEVGYGAGAGAGAEQPPFIVVTHEPPAPSAVRLQHLSFTFETSVAAAVAAASTAAPAGTQVVVMGGGSVVGQVLADGLCDELRIHLAPVVLGAGTPLFRPDRDVSLVQRDVVASPSATHLTYSVVAA